MSQQEQVSEKNSNAVEKLEAKRSELQSFDFSTFSSQLARALEQSHDWPTVRSRIANVLQRHTHASMVAWCSVSHDEQPSSSTSGQQSNKFVNLTCNTHASDSNAVKSQTNVPTTGSQSEDLEAHRFRASDAIIGWCVQLARESVDRNAPVMQAAKGNSEQLLAIPFLLNETSEAMLVLRRPLFSDDEFRAIQFAANELLEFRRGRHPTVLETHVENAIGEETVRAETVRAETVDEDTASVDLAVENAPTSETPAALHRMAALTELVSRIQSTDSVRAACQTLCDELQDYVKCERVFVGICRQNSQDCRLIAASGREHIDLSDSRDRRAQAVLQESVARGEQSRWPTDVGNRHGLLVHRQYSETNSKQAILSSPLRDEQGVIRGAIFFAGMSDHALSEGIISFVAASERPLASALQLIHRAERNWPQRFLHRVVSLMRSDRRTTCLLFAALVFGVLLMPMPYRVKCECETQPHVRRFVAAPFEGQLEKAFVEPGDVVRKHQVLALIDGREIRMELAGTEAELHRALKERAGHMAEHATGKAHIAKHEAERLRLKTELLNHRDENVEIRSPVDGIVISGDLRKVEGMPMTQGQSLFEIAPLDKMIVEISIPEDDIRFVQPGMPVRISLDAFPLERWNADVHRVHPRAELKANASVFIAEVEINNADNRLRPGMQGQCRVAVGRFPWGWNLFHKAFVEGLRWVGW